MLRHDTRQKVGPATLFPQSAATYNPQHVSGGCYIRPLLGPQHHRLATLFGGAHTPDVELLYNKHDYCVAHPAERRHRLDPAADRRPLKARFERGCGPGLTV